MLMQNQTRMCVLANLKAWRAAVQFDIAYRLGHDLVSEKVGSFTLKKLFRAEAFFGVDHDGGSSDPAFVRSVACEWTCFMQLALRPL